MKHISDKKECYDVGDLVSLLNHFNVDCPITPINCQYKMDENGNGSLIIESKNQRLQSRIEELEGALESIYEKDYVEKIGTVESLRKWVREFREIAKTALRKDGG